MPTREKVKELFALTQDSLPTFLLLDDCGKVIAHTQKTSDIKNIFAPFCGEANEVSCGNGQLEVDEVCDDGNLDENDACTALCQPTVCGDTIINTPNSE